MPAPQFIFTEETSKAIEQSLKKYMRDSKAKCALLLSKGGQLISQVGFTSNLNLYSIAALVGGIFTSTQALAHLIDETKFNAMFQEGKRWNVYFSLLVNHYIFATIFDQHTVIGMIRHSVGEVEKELSPYLKKAIVIEEIEEKPLVLKPIIPILERREEPPKEVEKAEEKKEETSPDFNKAVEKALSQLFT
ncbi:MAG: hypothetical protein AB1393_02725 [Candidatus Edwardsbacteria bacterium]